MRGIVLTMTHGCRCGETIHESKVKTSSPLKLELWKSESVHVFTSQLCKRPLEQ